MVDWVDDLGLVGWCVGDNSIKSAQELLHRLPTDLQYTMFVTD